MKAHRENNTKRAMCAFAPGISQAARHHGVRGFPDQLLVDVAPELVPRRPTQRRRARKAVFERSRDAKCSAAVAVRRQQPATRQRGGGGEQERARGRAAHGARRQRRVGGAVEDGSVPRMRADGIGAGKRACAARRSGRAANKASRRGARAWCAAASGARAC
jgi:hypothetical protein